LQFRPNLCFITPATAAVAFHSVATRAADEFEYRTAFRFAGNVPQREIDAADRSDVDAVPAEYRHGPAETLGKFGARSVHHPIPQTGNIPRVLADEQRSEFV